MISFSPSSRRMALLCVLIGLFVPALKAQDVPYADYFEEAYRAYPTVPPGLLESIAWTNTRVRHLIPTESCQELPVYYGVMGLVKDGKDYFQNSLVTVASLSGYSEQEIITSPRINILAYAKAYAALQQNKRMTSRSVESHRPIVSELSELPPATDGPSQFAHDQQYYMVLREMEKPHVNSRVSTRQTFNYSSIFGAENHRVLSASRVTMSNERISNGQGDTYTPSTEGSRTASCSANSSVANFGAALWSPAHSNNYGSRDGASVNFVTIHTVQGSYASAISWFRNSRARVSAHYIIRASDGQITQMVCENDKAYHVKTDNSEAIGIEHEGFIDDGGAWYTNEMYESSAALVRDICARYNINPLQTYGGPPTNGVNTLTNTCYKIKGHQHFRGNNHIDPGPFWDWDRFYRLVNPAPAPTAFTNRRGELFDSGGANGNYANQDRRIYLIAPPGATSLELEFVKLDLEGSTAKPYDYLDVYDGRDENGKFLGRFTGNISPGKLTAQSGAAFIEFRSDCQIAQGGWHVKYRSGDESAACGQPANLLASNLFAMGATLTWESEATRFVVLLRQRNDPRWTRYLLQEPQFIATGLKANSVYQWQVQAVCGGDSSAVAGATFVTPNLMGRGGQAQIFTIKALDGRFYDSGALDAGYGNDENYAYRISSPGGGRVQLTFTEFETEKDRDVLTIYDGNSFNSRVIGTYSGSDGPRQVLASGPELLIHFRSDQATNGRGWKATWNVQGATTPAPGPVNPGPTNPPTNPPTDPTRPNPSLPPVMEQGPFVLELPTNAQSPLTSPRLTGSYQGRFQLAFEDQDRSGRGFANRFYNVAERQGQAWRSRPQAGFFYDDFASGLQNHWRDVAGQWIVRDGRLVQTQVNQSNGNLYAELRQTGDRVYVYHWQARVSGPGNNRRHGLHFFASNPEQEDRGTSYFVWIRDTDGEDFVEIYKTVNDEFDRKAVRTIQMEAGKVYDFKTIYNPDKGRIEVYVNNQFSGSWVDPNPIREGRGISLRTGNCQLELDNLIVYHNRGANVQVEVSGALAPLSGSGEFLVNSLVVDRGINWSAVGQAQSRFAGGSQPSVPSPQPSTPTPEPATPAFPKPPVTEPSPGSQPQLVPSLPPTLQHAVRWNPGGSAQAYALAAGLGGKEWQGTVSRGFAFEEFSSLRSDWLQITGTWAIRFNTLQQTNPVEANSNIYLPLNQQAGQAYVYRFRTRLLTAGDNKRFGLHFLASSGAGVNRGNSYLVWFRYNESGADKVELYRSEANQMPIINAEAIVTIEPLAWYEITILADPATRRISVWMNNYPVIDWEDTLGFHSGGEAISFRTGNAQVQFDDLKVFQAVPAEGLLLDVGTANSSFPFKSQGNTPAARLIWLSRSGRGWASEQEQQRVVR